MKNKKNFLLPKIKILKILERSGTILKIYRSGKIPKIFKILTICENFEEFIWFTRPDRWSIQAFFVISRLFFLNLNFQHLKRYYSLILVPRFQEGIFEKKKIDVNLYLTLKLSTLRPKFFFSHVIIPFSTSLNCTKKEAIILCALISKGSFSIKHIVCLLIFLLKKTSLSLSKILFLRIILRKNLNLPKKILDFLVDFFFENKIQKNQGDFRNCFLLFFKNYSQFLPQEDQEKLFKAYK